MIAPFGIPPLVPIHIDATNLVVKDKKADEDDCASDDKVNSVEIEVSFEEHG